MSISFRILGGAGRDNALWVQVDSGQLIERLLFDCGEGCMSELPFADTRETDHLFFSHLHMDHVGGFDSFFRANFNRDTKVNRIWGPPQTAQIMQHRFRGFVWNLHETMAGTWCVSDIHPDRICTSRFELREAFATAHDEGTRNYESMICEGIGYTVEALTMDHRTPAIAYVVREKARRNIDPSRLAALGLKPGPWLKQLKDPPDGAARVIVNGTERSVEELRSALLVETPGDSIAYLTDFLLDDAAMERLAEALRGCRTIVCEGQYRHADLELARKNYHMTTVLAATLAQRVQPEELVIFHISDRYELSAWREMLREAREIFPKARYPEFWRPAGE
jgi:ribonuclease Z